MGALGEFRGNGGHLDSDAPWREEKNRGCRPGQYNSPGGSRKTSERFRTQPVRSAEHMETDRYCTAWLRVRCAAFCPNDHT